MVDAALLIVLLIVLFGVGQRCLRAVPFEHGFEEGVFAIGLGFGLLAYVTLALGEIGVLRRPALWTVLACAAWFGRRESVSGVARGLRGARRWAAAAPASEIAALLLGAGLLAVECVLVMAPAVGS